MCDYISLSLASLCCSELLVILHAGMDRTLLIVAFCCVVYFTTLCTSSFAGGGLMLRSKTCPIAAGRRFFYSVVVFYCHGSTMGCFRRFRRLKAISSASTVGCFRCYINLFRRPKTIQCLMVRAPFENQFPVWMAMLVGCMSLLMVGDDRWLSAFLYSLA